MAKRNTLIRGEQIEDALAGSALSFTAQGDALEVQVDNSTVEISGGSLQLKDLGVTNAKIADSTIADGKLASDYIQTSEVDDSTIEFNAGTLNIKALGVDTAQLAADAVDNTKLAADAVQADQIDTNNAVGAGVDGYVLTYNDTEGYMEWTSKIAITEDYLQESEIHKGDESANCDGIVTDFTLDNSPVANSVQVYLNGLLQQEGSGKDYTLTGTTVSFSTAPASGDILVLQYIAT